MRTNETKYPMGAIKVVAILVCVMMTIFCLTACNTNSTVHGEGAGQPTEENPHISEMPGIEEPNMPIDPGADIDVEPTTEVTTPSGSYTYDVDGVEITLRTDLNDYIHHDQYGYFVDIIGLANHYGFVYTGIHPDEPWMQTIFCLESNSEIRVRFEDDGVQDFYTVSYDTSAIDCDVHFTRNDIDDDAVITYYITDDANSYLRVNYEQIVIFAFMLENCADNPYDDFIENLGLTHTSGNQYVVRK